MKHSFLFLFVLVAALAVFEKVNAANIILNWDASGSPQVAGYDVYYGTTSGIYSYRVDAGNSTSMTISNLTPGATYYISATSYDASGDQSSFSSELSYTVPVAASAPALTFTPSATPGSPATLQFSAVSGHWYEVQATTDLVNWTSIWQSAVAPSDSSMQFSDPNAASYSSRFYRLVSH